VRLHVLLIVPLEDHYFHLHLITFVALVCICISVRRKTSIDVLSYGSYLLINADCEHWKQYLPCS
jgi:hypothetical protein